VRLIAHRNTNMRVSCLGALHVRSLASPAGRIGTTPAANVSQAGRGLAERTARGYKPGSRDGFRPLRHGGV